MDSAQVASLNVGIGKARTAAIYRRPSRIFEEQIKSGRVAALALANATPLQGGVPVFVDAKAALQRLNEELEHRVRLQVDEIITRAREVEDLNALLRVKSRNAAANWRRRSGLRSRVALGAGRSRPGGCSASAFDSSGTPPMAAGAWWTKDVTSSPDPLVAVKRLDSRYGSSETDLQRFIKDFSTIEAGRLELEQRPFNMRTALR